MVVYKYPLVQGRQVVPLPLVVRPLHAGMQDGNLFLWALVDKDSPGVSGRSVFVAGTGGELPADMATMTHLSTVFDGPYVWHVFYR